MITRAYRSLRRRGWAATLRSARRHLAAAWSKVIDRHFDAAFGTETRTVVENADLSDVTSANLVRGIRYEPTRALPLRRLLRAASVPTAGTFVDLGCGKGRACILAAMHGFEKVVGVDYSRALCSIAERNLDRFRSRTNRRFVSRVHAMDAADYSFAADDTVVYLFNPFDAAVLSAVMARLRRSLAEHPRSVWILYHNPVARSVVEAGGDFGHVGDWSFGGCDFSVFRNEGPRATGSTLPRLRP